MKFEVLLVVEVLHAVGAFVHLPLRPPKMVHLEGIRKDKKSTFSGHSLSSRWEFNRIEHIKGIREAAKKISTNGQAIKALPPPLKLNGHRNFSFYFSFFSLKIAENGF